MHPITRKTVQFFAFLLCFIIFHACQSTTNTKNENIQKFDARNLLGKWEAINDVKNVIELTETRMFSFYNGLKLADESLMIYNDCAAKCLPVGMKPMPCFVTDGKRADNCFKVIKLTDKILTYALIGNPNKVRKFQRIGKD